MSEPLDPRSVALRAAPPLAVLATVAALWDFAINRVAVSVLSEFLEPLEVLYWSGTGAFPQNLTGIAGLYALLSALSTYLWMPGFARLRIRLPVALFAGVMMPTLSLALVLPRERMSPLLVLVGMFASNALVLLFGAAVVGYRDRILRAGLACVMVTAVQSLVVVSVATARAFGHGEAFGALATYARVGGEVTWLLVPLVLLPAFVRGARSWRERGALVVGALVALGLVGLGLLGQQHLPPYYATVIYGALRLSALPEGAMLAYVVPVALGLGGAVAGLVSSDPWKRQLGVAVVLIIAGGYAPRSPIQILDLVLGVIVLARAAQSADPAGLARATERWGRGRGGQSAAPGDAARGMTGHATEASSSPADDAVPSVDDALEGSTPDPALVEPEPR